ncbi:TRM9B methyltransferase, partial [Pseudoatta argentina]
MSESDGEHAARSVALEQAYVHEVYEQCAEKTTQSKHWPRVYQFLQELEPGALVCDIGCGNGKYLSVNHSVFKIGVDRCKRFTDIAREKENEVLICDNLALPFREESFDAVLSIAVVHHFATTERRVHALKELARVLRIGGRLVISVWAMEQKHRKFESQDVLIPWPKSHCMSTASEGTKHSGVSDSSEKRDDDTAQKNQSSSKRNSQRKCKNKSYWIDPIFSLSPSTSSLSSPNETCYSCFRRALQKLARSRRGGDGRTWFPGSWQSSTKSRRHYDPEDTTDVDELPIELRRVETTHTLTMTNKHSTDTLSIKSKSLGDILEIERLDLVRSRSSIPGFSSTSELILDERSVSSSSSGSKPRLVKQKSYVEEIGLENPEDTAIENLIKDLPDFSCQSLRKRNIPLKQSSMNEELMSAERLEEKERVRRNIMKQASLNEELICKWRTFEALKDSISPVSASRRFQLLKNGLTNKLKRSTTNIEKVSSMSIKNGFVRMLQGWKSCDNESASAATEATKPKPTDNKVQPVTMVKRSIEGVERRLSREDGSDSSKDSSLQSDTSVDSEDSFASVIYVPKQDVTAPPASSSVNEVPSAPRPAALQLSMTSAPPSPRVKQPLDGGQSSRFKMISMSPLLKQQSIVTNTNANTNTNLGDAMKSNVPIIVVKETFDNTLQAPASGGLRLISEPDEESDTTSLIHAFNDVTKVVNREPVVSKDDSRKARLNQIKELLIAKPGFATRARPSFPLVRRASTAASGRLETVTRILPRLLSLELFNPETDDLDSDSSGVSSPESVGSVISVTSDERYIARKEAEEKKNNVQTDENLSKSNGDDISKRTRETESSIRDDESSSMITTASFEDSNTPLDPPHDDSSADLEDDTFLAETEIMRDISQDNLETDTICSTSRIFLKNEKSISSQSMKLLRAAANVASSLEDAVEKAIQHNAQVEQFSQVAQRQNNDSIWSQSNVRTRAYLKEDYKSTSEDLGDYESSSDIIRDISRYCQNSSFGFLEVCQTLRSTSSSSSSDVAKNNLNTESDTTACWDECNQVPKETSWIVNEVYNGGGYKFANVVQSKLTPKFSRSLCNDTVFESEFDSKFPCNSKYEIELEAEPKTTFISKYDEPFRVNRESEEKLKIEIDLVSRSNLESNSNLMSDTKKSFINAESTLNLQSGARLKSNINQEQYCSANTSSLLRSNSDDTMDFVMVSKTGEEEFEEDAKAVGKWRSSHSRLSMDSSDVGDSLIENTGMSLSDGSQTESTARLFTGSTVSLISNPNVGNTRRCSVERRRLQERGHSLDEMSSETKKREGCLVTASTNTLSNASSQESLPSDRGGGSITYHQYYHVFREGELDQLINKYVENLHIISSYYDHASWCIVAEKVQVWTI